MSVFVTATNKETEMGWGRGWLGGYKEPGEGLGLYRVWGGEGMGLR